MQKPVSDLPVWLRVAVLGVGLCVSATLLMPAAWTDQVPGLKAILAGPPNQPPQGFTIKDPLDPAMQTGYRHPFYTGHIAPDDRLFRTSDPALAAFAGREYSLELNRNDSDPTFGWVSIRLPDGLVKAGAEALRPAACTVFRAIVAEPSHTSYKHLLMQMFDDEAAVRFDLRTEGCGF